MLPEPTPAGFAVLKTIDPTAVTMSRREQALVDQISRLRAEVERLQAIVDRLPKTADGVPVVPWVSDLFIYIKPFGVVAGVWNARFGLTVSTPEGDYAYVAPEMYSTREAAEAAGGEACTKT